MTINIDKHYNYLSDFIIKRYSIAKPVRTPKSEIVKIKDGVKLYKINNHKNYLADLNSGRVYSLKSKRYLKHTTHDARGYVRTHLVDDQGNSDVYGLHQIILSVALGIDIAEYTDYGLVTDHINKDKSNNSYKNLRVVDISHNIRNSTRGYVLGEDDIKKIRNDYKMVLNIKRWLDSIKNKKEKNEFKKIVQKYNTNYLNKERYIAHKVDMYKVSQQTIRNIIDNKTYKKIS